MKEIQQMVSALLLAHQPLVALVQNRIRPVIADQADVVPFVTYQVKKQTGITKDMPSSYSVTFSVFASTSSVAVEGLELCCDALQDQAYFFQQANDSDSDVSREDYYVEQITFNIIK